MYKMHYVHFVHGYVQHVQSMEEVVPVHITPRMGVIINHFMTYVFIKHVLWILWWVVLDPACFNACLVTKLAQNRP
jgi:hypothetical protein